MQPVNIKLVKQTYKMDDGNLISGVQVIVAPMIYKFISLNNQKLSLLEEIRPSFYQWFMNVPDGTSMDLFEAQESHPTLPENYHEL